MASPPPSTPEHITPPPPTASSSAAQSATTSPAPSDHSLPQHPDTFEDFIESGDRSADVAPVAQNTSPRLEAAGSFFTGLFKKATATIETTIEQAKRDISRNDVLSNAQESLSGLGNAVPNALTGVSEMVSERRLFGDRAPPTPTLAIQALTNTPLPEKTMPLKPLKVTSAAAPPLLLFVNTLSQNIFVVTDAAIETFRPDGTRLPEVRMRIPSTNSPDSPSTPASPSSLPRPPTPAKPTTAISAAYLPATDEIVVGLADGSLRIYSVAPSRTGTFIRSIAALDAIPTSMHLTLGRPRRLIVGMNDGSVRVLDPVDLKTLAHLRPPEICTAPLGSNLRDSPVSCLGAASLSDAAPADTSVTSAAVAATNVFVGYEDGAVMLSGLAGGSVGAPFIAQAGRVSAMAPLYGGVLLLTIGNEADPSLAAYEARTGRCLVRRMVPYTPTSISTVPTAARNRSASDCVCPSENAFIVGGDEGQLEVFRAVVLSPRKIELRLVRRISERVRGRRRAVMDACYNVPHGLMMALSSSGEVRRWRLSKTDANSLSILNEDVDVKCTYNERNIVASMAEDFNVRDETRLSSVEGVIQAQRILAAILEDTSVNESGKDLVVEEFQKKQAEMQDMASQADAELRRARRRIAGRFAAGLAASTTEGTDTEKRLARAARRTTAFELEFATRRHGETLKRIQVTAVERLKSVLLDSLKGLSQGASERIVQAKRDAECLGMEEETEY